jgi:hypothetical protein
MRPAYPIWRQLHCALQPWILLGWFSGRHLQEWRMDRGRTVLAPTAIVRQYCSAWWSVWWSYLRLLPFRSVYSAAVSWHDS